MTKTLLMLKL